MLGTGVLLAGMGVLCFGFGLLLRFGGEKKVGQKSKKGKKKGKKGKKDKDQEGKGRGGAEGLSALIGGLLCTLAGIAFIVKHFMDA